MDDNIVHIGTDDKATARWRWFTRRVVLVPLAALILVGVCAWVFLQAKSTNDKKRTQLDTVIKASDEAFQDGNYSQSLQSLKKATDKAQSKDDKVKLYNQLSAASANAGKVTEAVDYMNQKHELDPGSIGADANVLGSYYEILGDNDNAIKQYKLSIEYEKSQPKNQRSDANIQSLNIRIQSLEGGGEQYDY
jgi:tetratricopeptide (TPR) repeat protein